MNAENEAPGARAIHHVGVVASDLFVSELFYRRVLGFELDYRYRSRNQPGLRTVMLRRGGARVELLGRLPGQTAGGHHCALAVDAVAAAYEAACAAAGANGFSTAGWRAPRETGDGWLEATVLDPDGFAVEMAQALRPKRRAALEAVIFDFDGTLADSEPNYFRAAQRLLGEYGIAFSAAENARYVGGGNTAMLTDLIERYRLPVDFERLAARKDEIYLELALADTKPFPAMLRFLGLAKARGLPVAVASGSSTKVLEALLAQMGLRREFEVVLSSELVPAGKPAPDVFLEAARRLGVDGESCLVVEDSAPGVEAAVRGGMACLAIPSMPGETLDRRFFLADRLVAGGMADFDPAAALAWLERFPLP